MTAKTAAKKSQNKPSKPSNEFNLFSFVWRFVASLALVLASYNPSEYSYFHWIRSGMSSSTLGPEYFVGGILLLIGWMILLGATQRSLGGIGLFLVGALLAGLVWLAIDVGLLSLDSTSATAWVVQICIALALAIGLSWSHVWRRLTGQFEVDDGDG
jgi:hypothetical protein